jgi:hypothetical protein
VIGGKWQIFIYSLGLSLTKSVSVSTQNVITGYEPAAYSLTINFIVFSCSRRSQSPPTKRPPEITLGDIPDQTRIFHVSPPRQFVRDKRLEPREPPRFHFVGFLIQTSTKLPSPSSLNRTPFIVPSAGTCALAIPPRTIQTHSIRSGFGSPPVRVKLLSLCSSLRRFIAECDLITKCDVSD